MLQTLDKHRHRVLWLALALCLAGLLLYEQMPIALLPKTQTRNFGVVVQHSLPPDSDELIDIERTVRQEVGRLTPSQEILSEISTGQITTALLVSDPDPELQDRLGTSLVENITRKFPGVRVWAVPMGSESLPVMDLVVEPRIAASSERVSYVAAKVLATELLQLPEVSAISTFGESQSSITLSPDSGQSTHTAPTLRELAHALEPPQSIYTSTFGNVVVREPMNANRLPQLLVPGTRPAGARTLSELFHISQSERPEMIKVRSNGKPAVLIKIFKNVNFSETKISAAVREKSKQIAENNPDLEIRVVSDSADYINAAQDNVVGNVKWGIILTCLCILVFARNLRYTFLVSLSIPLSLFLTFPFLYLLGISRNVMSLAGIALSVGVVVDATISVMDSIEDEIKSGFSPREASWRAARENFIPVLLTSTTTLAVFIPILFLPGTVGDLFRDLSLTVIVSQSVAFFVAIFLTPAFTSVAYDWLESQGLLGLRSAKKAPDSFWVAAFVRMVRASMRTRASVWTTTLVLIAASVWGVSVTPSDEFLPKRVTQELRLRVDIGRSADMESRNRAEDILDNQLKKIGATGRLLISDTGLFTADMVLESNKTVRDVERAIESALPGAAVQGAFRNPIDPRSSDGIDLDFFIPWEQRTNVEFQKQILAIDGVSHVRWSHKNKGSEGRITSTARELLGLPSIPGTERDLLNSIYGTTVVGILTAEETESGFVPLIVRNQKPRHPVTGAALSSDLHSYLSQMVTAGETFILRNGSPVLKAEVQVKGRTSQEVSRDIEYIADKSAVPLFWGEAQEESGRNMRDLAISLGVASLIIVVILLAQNRSLGMTIVIFFTFVWAMIGAIPALAIHGETMNASAMVGFILLAGTIVNNGILLVEIVDRSRRLQMTPLDSCLTAVKQRTVPVLVTALTTAIGMIPMAFDTGEGSQMYRALSIVVVYGTIASTPLSLIGVPCLVMIVCDSREYFSQLRLRLVLAWHGKGQRT